MLITDSQAPEAGSSGVREAVQAFLQQHREGVGSLQAGYAWRWDKKNLRWAQLEEHFPATNWGRAANPEEIWCVLVFVLSTADMREGSAEAWLLNVGTPSCCRDRCEA